MSGKHFLTAETIVEQIDSSTVDEEGKRRFGHRYGMNLILQSAFLRMTLVGTSTVVAVTSIAFLAIGVCAQSKTDSAYGNEDRVLLAGGVILLIASFLQFITVGVLSGWCSSIWPSSARSYDREIHLLPPNHFLINGQMVNVKTGPSSAGTDSSTLIPCSGYELIEPNLQVIPEEDAEQFSRTVPVWTDRQQIVPVLEVAGGNTGVGGDATKVDATTSTRGEMVYFPVRGYAPLALQEEMTPSLRSSFQSFDELA